MQLAGSGQANETVGDWVCKDSQAELFSQAFYEYYGDDISISYNSYEQSNHLVTIKGTLTHAGQSSSYEAAFTIDPDGDGMLGGFFGCIERIEQRSPTFDSSGLGDFGGADG
jgi:hypothetical protein